jgi:hypothetical protein
LGSKFTRDKEKLPHEVFPMGTNGSSSREKKIRCSPMYVDWASQLQGEKGIFLGNKWCLKLCGLIILLYDL